MEKMEFDYFRGIEGEQYSFYRVPKVLFTAECFRKLSCEAKVLYGLMLDRMSLSVKNKWIDEENRVYIIFTVEEIMDLLGCGKQKAVKSLAELDSEKGIGLIEKKRLGLGRANVIYVKNFMLKETIETEEKSQESLENTQKYENQTSRSMKIKLQEVPKSNSNNTEINDTEYSDTEYNPSYPSYPYSASMSKIENPDAMEKMDTYRRQIQENIAYDDFLQQKTVTRNKLDELVELMVEVMMLPNGQAIRIAGADRPVEVVKSRFMQIGYSHIEYVIRCLDNNTTKVGNIKAYLLTALYNSVMTMDHYYQAEVQHGMYG